MLILILYCLVVKICYKKIYFIYSQKGYFGWVQYSCVTVVNSGGNNIFEFGQIMQVLCENQIEF